LLGSDGGGGGGAWVRSEQIGGVLFFSLFGAGAGQGRAGHGCGGEVR
jgi:hypothetical protein